MMELEAMQPNDVRDLLNDMFAENVGRLEELAEIIFSKTGVWNSKKFEIFRIVGVRFFIPGMEFLRTSYFRNFSAVTILLKPILGNSFRNLVIPPHDPRTKSYCFHGQQVGMEFGENSELRNDRLRRGFIFGKI
jgi:hypothetical protein